MYQHHQYYEDELSPTDTSEDSIEVSVKPVHKKFTKNKRKSVEPRRVRLAGGSSEDDWVSANCQSMTTPAVAVCRADYNENEMTLKRKISPHSRSHLAPKKRFKMDALLQLERENMRQQQNTTVDAAETKCLAAAGVNGAGLAPFRPWDDTKERVPSPTGYGSSTSPVPSAVSPSLAVTSPLLPMVSGLPTTSLPFILSYALRAQNISSTPASPLTPTRVPSVQLPEQEEPLSLVVNRSSPCQQESWSGSASPTKSHIKKQTSPSSTPSTPTSPFGSPTTSRSPSKPATTSGRKQTNYKSITKDRRVEANARERQRVHTITAAFDTLQAAIPTEDDTNKLSKLSVIKIATAYIMALSRMAGYDYTEDKSAPSVEAVVEACRHTISTETKMKNKKN